MKATGTVVVVGAGGNIGSQTVPHVARMAGVRRVTLIDSGVYEEKNLTSQAIEPPDVGRPKAILQARRLHAINPALSVTAVGDVVANVPLGLLRGDVVLACLDSRAARCAVNLSAWRLGIPWIDSGVHGAELLARVNVYLPGPEQPCYECAFDARDYEMLEQSYPCAGQDTPPATNAPSGLGALAAALQVLECQKLLAGNHAQLAVGRQVTISALAHRCLVTRFPVNTACRFDHDVWDVVALERGAERLTVGQVLAFGREASGESGSLRLGIPHQAFTTALACPPCGRRVEISLHLIRRLSVAAQACADCGGRMRAAGTDVIEWLPEADLSPAVKDTPLHALGFRDGDVVTVAGVGRESHFEIGGTV
jgi:molybdopterin/thiamine biosynthesis adenylyltransferase